MSWLMVVNSCLGLILKDYLSPSLSSDGALSLVLSVSRVRLAWPYFWCRIFVCADITSNPQRERQKTQKVRRKEVIPEGWKESHVFSKKPASSDRETPTNRLIGAAKDAIHFKTNMWMGRSLQKSGVKKNTGLTWLSSNLLGEDAHVCTCVCTLSLIR